MLAIMPSNLIEEDIKVLPNWLLQLLDFFWRICFSWKSRKTWKITTTHGALLLYQHYFCVSISTLNFKWHTIGWIFNFLSYNIPLRLSSLASCTLAGFWMVLQAPDSLILILKKSQTPWDILTLQCFLPQYSNTD